MDLFLTVSTRSSFMYTVCVCVQGGDVVVVKVGVGGVEEGKCQVTFRERTLEIRFQTR